MEALGGSRNDDGEGRRVHLSPIPGSRWAFFREVAVRAPGFPVEGLEVFGPDEAAGLAAVAADELFQEAVTWQNRDTLRNAILKVAAGTAGDDSAGRRRLDTVASYWQRYTAKNETIGFFGPLGWGRFDDGEPRAIDVRPGPGLCASRAVRFEVWAMQALADVVGARIGRELRVGVSPNPEVHLRELLEEVDDAEVRAAALAHLDRLEVALGEVRAATGAAAIGAAMDRLDETFEAITGAEPRRNAGMAYGARTLSYLDCRRDIDVRIGPALRDALGEALLPLLPPARWYCGETAALVRALIDERARAVAGPDGRMPAGALFGQVAAQVNAIPSEMQGLLAEVRQRFTALLAAGPEDLAARSEAAFADSRPAWRSAMYMSPDVQIAARDSQAIEDGDFLLVVGDFHAGCTTFEQAFMSEQHPDPDDFRRQMTLGVEQPRVFPVPSPNFERMTGRICPTWATPEDLCLLTTPDAAVRRHLRPLAVAECTAEVTAEGVQLVSGDGSVRGPFDDALWLLMFLLTVKTYSLIPGDEVLPRLTAGRAVLRRATWNVRAGDAGWALGPRMDAGAARRWAEDAGLPRRTFALAPVEDKPFYVDLTSPTLLRQLGRAIKRTAAVHGADATVRISEMLPAPEDCWLTDRMNRCYTSELRLTLVDLDQFPSQSPWSVAGRGTVGLAAG